MDVSLIDLSQVPEFGTGDFTPDEIQTRALKTWTEAGGPEGQLVHSVMGLAGESGELLDKVKKCLFKPGYELTPEDFRDEVGDILYYLAVLTSLMGLTFEDLSVMNRAKLEGGGHGWQENEAEDMVTFTPEEAEKRIKEAVKSTELGPTQFNAVVMGILKGLENYLGIEVILEFHNNIYKGGNDMVVHTGDGSALFIIFLPRTRMLGTQRK